MDNNIKMKDSDFIVYSIYNILYINDMGFNQIMELRSFFEKVEDKQAKKIYKALRKRAISYNEYIKTIIGGSNLYFFAEFNSSMDDFIDGKMERYIKVVAESFSASGYDNPSLLAKLEVTYSIIKYSIANIDDKIKRIKEFNGDYMILNFYKMNESFTIIKNLCEWCTRKIKEPLYCNSECKELLQDIFNTLNDYAKIIISLNNAKENERPVLF